MQVNAADSSSEQYSIGNLRSQDRLQTAINIFSSNWIREYGVARTFSFVCAAGSNLVTGHGVVLSIVGG